MHARLSALLLALLWAVPAWPALAGELGPAESAALRQDAQAMMAAFARGDTDLIIARTHPSLKQLAGATGLCTDGPRHGQGAAQGRGQRHQR